MGCSEQSGQNTINQIFVRILFIICIVSFTSYSGVNEAFEHLRQNRDAINDALSQCPGSTLRFPLCGPFMDEFKTALADTSVADSTIVKTVSRYLSDIDAMSYLFSRKKTDVISDDISVIFLSELIICSGNDDGFVGMAVQILRNRVSYASLKKHKKLLDTALSKSCSDVSIRSKNEIRILMGGLSEAEKKEMLASRDISLPYLARLGDTLAIKHLRTQYHSAKTFRNKEVVIYEIFHSGQMDLIKMAILDFNDPMYRVYSYKGAPPCTSLSTRYAILQGVRRSYSYEKLLNEDLIEALYVREKNSSFEHNKRYNELVTKWLEKQYGVKINNKPETFIIKKFFGCASW